MMAALDPMPVADPVTAGAPATVGAAGVVTGGTPADKPQFMGGRWVQWFYNAIINRLGFCAYRVGTPVSLTAQKAAIGATPIQGTTGGGRFRVNYYLHVSTGDAAATLQLRITWTKGARVLTILSTQLNPPATDNVLAASVPLNVDTAASILYGVTYSNPGGPLVYELDLDVEALP